MLLVSERTTKSKHLQRVFGVTPLLYYAVNLFYDFVSLRSPAYCRRRRLKHSMPRNFAGLLYGLRSAYNRRLHTHRHSSVHVHIGGFLFIARSFHLLRVGASIADVQRISAHFRRLDCASCRSFTSANDGLACRRWRSRSSASAAFFSAS